MAGHGLGRAVTTPQHASGAVRWGMLAGDVVSLASTGPLNTIAGFNLLVTGAPSPSSIDSLTSGPHVLAAGNLLNSFIHANNTLGNHALVDNGANLARAENGLAYLGTRLRDNVEGRLPWRDLSDSQTSSPAFLVQARTGPPVVQQPGPSGHGVGTLPAPGAEMRFSFDATSRSLTFQQALQPPQPPLPPDPTTGWANPAGGDWHAAGNRSTQRVPERDTFATIAPAGNATVRLDGNAATVWTPSLGGSVGSATGGTTTLALDGATLTAAVSNGSIPAVRVLPTGVLKGTGVIVGDLSNQGLLQAEGGLLQA